MKKIYAGDYVRILNARNVGGKAGRIWSDNIEDGDIRIVRGVRVHRNEIQIKVRDVEGDPHCFEYSYSRHHVEPVLTASGKNKRHRFVKGEIKPERKPYPEIKEKLVDVFNKAAGIIPAKAAPVEAPVAVDAYKARFLQQILNLSGVSNWMCHKNTGWELRPDRICHASIGEGTILRHWEGIAGVYQNIKGEAGRQQYQRWFDYVVNRSPWAHVFITKSFEEALTQHVEVDVNIASPIVMGAITALRTGHEFSRSVKLFCELLDSGVPEFAAFAATQFMSGSDRTYQHGGIASNHTVWAPSMNPLDVLTFMKNGYTDDIKKMFKFKDTRRDRDYSFAINKSIAPCDHKSWKVEALPWIVVKKGDWSVNYMVDFDKFVSYVKEMK